MNKIPDPFVVFVNKLKHDLRVEGVKCLRSEKVQCPLCVGKRKSVLSIQQVRNHIRSPTHLAQLREYQNHFKNSIN